MYPIILQPIALFICLGGNKLTIYGITTNEIILDGNNTLIMLGGPDGIDLPFTRIYREYGIDPIPEDC